MHTQEEEEEVKKAAEWRQMVVALLGA